MVNYDLIIYNDIFFAERIDGLYYKNLEITLIKGQEKLPKEFVLFQNYSNPFNSSTTINYIIPKSGFVTIKIYNILGKEITELVNEEKPADSYQVQFNAGGLASGVYIYSMNAGEYSKSRLMILEK